MKTSGKWAISFLSVFAVLTAAEAAPEPGASSSAVFPPNEAQYFILKFIDTTAGDFKLETLASTVWEGKGAHHFRATVRTIGLIGVIYPYTEVVDVYLDREKLLPLYVDINVKDRKKTQRTQIRLDGKTLRGEELEDSSEPGTPDHHRKKTWAMTAGSQSLFTILHFLRTQNIKPGAQVEFPVSHDEKNLTFAADVAGTEKVKIGKGEKEALLLNVHLSFAQSYYPNLQEKPRLWLSNDDRKSLVRFEMRHKLGKVWGVLQNP